MDKRRENLEKLQKEVKSDEFKKALGSKIKALNDNKTVNK